MLCLILLLSLILVNTAPVTGQTASALVTWTPYPPGVVHTGYRITRKVGQATYQELARVAAGVTKFTDATLVPGMMTCYQIEGESAMGLGPPSDERCVILLPQKNVSITFGAPPTPTP